MHFDLSQGWLQKMLVSQQWENDLKCLAAQKTVVGYQLALCVVLDEWFHSGTVWFIANGRWHKSAQSGNTTAR